MVPASGRSRPPIRCSSVDLPVPERPRIATTSPRWTWMPAPSSTRRAARPSPKDLTSPEAATTAGIEPTVDRSLKPGSGLDAPALVSSAQRCLLGCGLQVQRRAVDAVAQPACVLRAVVEHVAEVAAALLARHLGPDHEVRQVALGLDVLRERGLGEARPARTRVELGLAGEQLRPAAGAAVHAVLVAVP